MRNLKRVSLLLIVAFVATLFVGCGIGTTAGEPAKPAKDVVKEAFDNFYKVKSGNYEVTSKGNMTPATATGVAKMGFDVKLNGVFDGNDPKVPRFTLAIDGSGTAEGKAPQVFATEIRVDKDKVFAILSKFPDLGESFPKEIITPYVGKWWTTTIPPEMMSQLQLPTAQDETTMTPEQKEMKEFIKGLNFFDKIVFVGVETVDGADGYVYSAELSREAIKSLVEKGAKLQKQEIKPEELKKFDDFLKNLSFPAKIYIGKSDMTLRKIAGTVELKPIDTGAAFIMDLGFSVTGLNQAVKIEEPAGAQQFDLSGLLGGAPVPAPTK